MTYTHDWLVVTYTKMEWGREGRKSARDKVNGKGRKLLKGRERAKKDGEGRRKRVGEGNERGGEDQTLPSKTYGFASKYRFWLPIS